MKARFYILFLLLSSVSIAFGQGTKFTAVLSQTKVGEGEQFEIDFTVNANGENFIPPSFSDFQVLAGPLISTSVTSVNGNTRMQMVYGFVLAGTKEGSFTLGPASITVSGKRYKTNPVTVQIVRGHTQAQNRQSAGGQQSQQQQQQIAEDKSGDLSKDIFLKAVVDKANAYLGEQLTLSYRLYMRVNVMGYDVDKVPQLNDFWSEDVKRPSSNIQPRVELYRGERYRAVDIKQTILFPEHAGTFTVDPLGMTFVVQQPVRSNDPFDQFFGGSYKQVKVHVKSPPVIIHVKPLPEAGKPVGFNGAVGTYSISASIDKDKLKSNESLNYRVLVKGKGNLKLLKDPTPAFPADFEKYDPKVTDSINDDVNGVSGTRLYNYLLIPRHQGNFTILPVNFSYFNPATGRYATLATKPFTIAVEKGATTANVTAFSDEDQNLQNKDIRYIKQDASLRDTGHTFYGSAGWYALLLLGPLLFVGAYGYYRWDIKHNSDIVKVKSRKAGRMASKHLSNAQKQLQANNTRAFYEDISKGLYGYLADKFTIPYADLNKENIAETLKARNVSEDAITQLLETLNLCEMARFAPITGISAQEVFNKANNIINDIENKS